MNLSIERKGRSNFSKAALKVCFSEFSDLIERTALCKNNYGRGEKKKKILDIL